MTKPELTGVQWMVLDLLASAGHAGYPYVHRQQILNSSKISDTAKARLVWAALTMPDDLIDIRNKDEFHLTELGKAALAMRFGFVRGDGIENPTGPGADLVLDMPAIGMKPN